MQNKTIKFFISSTFKDFIKERNALQNFVFPRLKKLCQKKGFSFQPVDLRWGITVESSEDNKTMEYCLNEVRRCSYDPKPNLLILFGQRYGWGPLPSDITIQEWDYIKSKVTKDELVKLENWYIQDLNDIDRKYFLKDKKGFERKEWEGIEKDLKNIIPTSTLDNKDEVGYSRFYKSATELEIIDALEKQYKSNSDNTIVYNRKFNDDINEDLIEGSEAKTKEEKAKAKEIQNKLEKLGNFINQKKITNIYNSNIDTNTYKNFNDEYHPVNKESYAYPENMPEYLENFCESVYNEFKDKINTEIAKYNKKFKTPFKTELEEQKIFLKEKSKLVLGRKDEIKKIVNFITDSENTEQYYLLYGKSGTGKTSVMAKALTKIKDKNNEFNIYYRFIGTTAYSTYSRQVFESIYREIESKLSNNENLPKVEFEIEELKFKKQFQELLQRLDDKKVVIFLDAIDQFEDDNDLNILLDNLPKNIKIIFSVLYDENKTDNNDYTKYYKRLSNIKNNTKLDILDQSFNIQILKQLLEKDNRTLSTNKDNNQQNLVESFIKGQTPLCVKLTYEIVREWTSREHIDRLKEELPSIDCENKEEALIIKFFNNVIKKHYVNGELLNLTLGLISASKDGLSETELIDIISNEEKILKSYDKDQRYQQLNKLPDAIFSKMYYHIQDIFTEKLIDGEMLINPYHRIVEETIKKHIYEKDNETLHTEIADYFEKYHSQARKNRELPWSYYNLDNFNKLSKFLYDPFNMSILYKEYKTDLFFYYNFLSKREENKQILEINFKLQEMALYLFNKNNKVICDDVSERALNIGLFYKDISKYEYAKKIFLLGINSQGVELPNNVLSYVGVFVDLNLFEDALKVINEFSTDKIKDNSFFISLNSLKAVIYKRLGKYDEALKLYSNLNDDNLTILYNKAVLLKRSGKKEKSKDIFENILSRSISDFEFKLAVQSSYASLLRQLGKIDEAYKLLKKLYKDAIEYFPEDNALLFSIGNNYSKVCIEVDDEEIKKESLKIQEELLIRNRKVHGDSINENGLLLKHNLSETNFILGKTLEAKNYAKEAYEGRRELFDIEHTDTILSLLSYFKLIIMEENFDKQILANYFKDLYLHRDLIYEDDKYDKEILNLVLQEYCHQYYEQSCEECSEIFFHISNHLKQQDNYEKAVDYDIKRFQCSISHLSKTKNYYNFIAVSTTLAGTYYKLNLKDKVIEIEKVIVDILRSNYSFIFNEQKVLSKVQYIKSIRNLSESLQDNGYIKESIQFKEEVLDLRYKEGVQITSTLDTNTGEIIEKDIYGIYKIEVDEYIDSINQLAATAYKNNLLYIAEKTLQKAIEKSIENLEKDYDKYFQKTLDYSCDLAVMFLFNDLDISKDKYENILTFIQNEFKLNKISKKSCIDKQKSILNGIKKILEMLLSKNAEMSFKLCNLIINLYLILFRFDNKNWIQDLIELKKLYIKLLKDNNDLKSSINYEMEIGKYLLEYKHIITNWERNMMLHFNNLATSYYHLDLLDNAIIIANKLLKFIDENSIKHDLYYQNAYEIIDLSNKGKNVDFNEPFETLLIIAKGINIKYNYSKKISFDDLYNALHSVELNEESLLLFKHIFGESSINNLNKDKDGQELIILAEKYHEIEYDFEFSKLVNELANYFDDKYILRIR